MNEEPEERKKTHRERNVSVMISRKNVRKNIYFAFESPSVGRPEYGNKTLISYGIRMCQD